MPVTQELICRVTGISFQYVGEVKPVKDKVVHPSLYGFDLSYLVNALRNKLRNKVYDKETVELSRLLLIHSLWAVNINTVSLAPILYDKLEEDDIRYELGLGLSLYNTIPKDRFNITRLDRSNPWQQLGNILKTYGVEASKTSNEDFYEWMQLTYDDVMAELINTLDTYLIRYRNNTLSMMDLISLKKANDNLPTKYLWEILQGHKGASANKLTKILKDLEKFDKDISMLL